MKLVLLFSLLLAVQLCSSQMVRYRPDDYQPRDDDRRCSSDRRPDDRCRYDDRYRHEQCDEPKMRDYSEYDYFSSCKEILRRYPETPSGYYYIKAGPDSYRKVYCEMEKKICGERGWEKFYHMDLMKNQTEDCPDSFVKKMYQTFQGPKKYFCGKETDAGKCTKAYFRLEERQYHEVCAKVSGYQYGTPSAFKPYDVEDSKFYMDGIHFTYGKEERQLWSYVCGAHRDHNKDTMTTEKLRMLCPEVSPKYKWFVPHYLGNTYYCDSGLYKYNDVSDTTKFHNQHRLWEGKDCEFPNHGCRYSGQPWSYRKFPMYMEDYIEMRSCYMDDKADVKFDNLEIYLR